MLNFFKRLTPKVTCIWSIWFSFKKKKIQGELRIIWNKFTCISSVISHQKSRCYLFKKCIDIYSAAEANFHMEKKSISVFIYHRFLSVFVVEIYIFSVVYFSCRFPLCELLCFMVHTVSRWIMPLWFPSSNKDNQKHA